MEELKKEFIEKGKELGLEIAEDSVAKLVELVFEMVPKFAAATENTYDDLAVSMLPLIKPKIMEFVDLIDKKEG